MEVVQNSKGEHCFRSVGCGRIQLHAEQLSGKGPCITTRTQPDSMAKDARTIHNTEYHVLEGLSVILRTWLALVSKVYYVSKIEKMAFTEECAIPEFNVMER
jgi:hypothetical protein